jgi:hypothetical protein
MYLTLDQLIEHLIAVRNSGVSGDTPVVRPSRTGFMRRVEGTATAPIAELHIEESRSLCKVAPFGVNVLVVR